MRDRAQKRVAQPLGFLLQLRPLGFRDQPRAIKSRGDLARKGFQQLELVRSESLGAPRTHFEHAQSLTRSCERQEKGGPRGQNRADWSEQREGRGRRRRFEDELCRVSKPRNAVTPFWCLLKVHAI